MEKSSDSRYKKEIEALKESADFEKEGDKLFLDHSEKEARLLWAFHRPSGSHPSQIEDEDFEVSAMAFNHSRLPPLERIRKVHKALLTEENIIKINNRMRMLFRSLTDSDFKELLVVIKEFPFLKNFAINQCINGRRIQEVNADIEALSEFLEIAGEDNKKLLDSIYERVGDFEDMDKEDMKEFLHTLKGKKIHPTLLKYIKKKLEEFCKRHSLHILQQKSLEKILKEAEIE